MIKKLTDALKELGFEEKESNVYITLLKIGEVTATRISKETGIERTLIYYILQKLQEKGLVSYKLKNNVKYHNATDPQHILDSLNDKIGVCKDLLPELKKLQSSTSEEEVIVNIYKGFQGLKAVMRDLFTGTKEILVLGEQGQFAKNYPEYGHVYLHLLKKNNIKERVIARTDFKGKIPGGEKSEYRYLPKASISPTTTVIYQNKIVISIWEKPTHNILIKSKKIAESYKAYFNQLWKQAKP